jgi:hypothetical protein
MGPESSTVGNQKQELGVRQEVVKMAEAHNALSYFRRDSPLNQAYLYSGGSTAHWMLPCDLRRDLASHGEGPLG